MENSDAFSSSTAPLTWHDFLERMRHPSASDFVKSIKSFIVSFSNSSPDPEKDSAAVQQFLEKMEVAFRAHSLWAGRSEEELESAGEGLEKYVMTKLFTRAFASNPEDKKQDELLYEKMAFLQQFIQPENLDIKDTFQNETSWLLAQKEIQKINMYKAPRDKLICILNCCKVINNLLLNASIASNQDPPGADEFLPVLIYVTIKANPPQLHSNLMYIQRYRRKSRLVSETAYFFTNILSAESFISNINGESLSMHETEFQRNMESAQALLSGMSPDNENFLDSKMDTPPSTFESPEPKLEQSISKRDNIMLSPAMSVERLDKLDGAQTEVKSQTIACVSSVLDIEKKGAHDLLKENQLSSFFRAYPFLYAQVGDLTLEEVDILLRSYKDLVLKYVSLSKGLENNGSSFTLLNSQSHTKNLDVSDITLRMEGTPEKLEDPVKSNSEISTTETDDPKTEPPTQVSSQNADKDGTII